jgi:hypothetical protein
MGGLSDYSEPAQNGQIAGVSEKKGASGVVRPLTPEIRRYAP